VVRASIWRPWATVLLSGLLALMAGLYTFRSLDFITSSLRLLPQHARYVMLLGEYLNDFSEMDDIIVAIEASSPNHAKRYADRLVGALRHDGLRSRITYRIDPRFFQPRGLLHPPPPPPLRLPHPLFPY